MANWFEKVAKAISGAAQPAPEYADTSNAAPERSNAADPIRSGPKLDSYERAAQLARDIIDGIDQSRGRLTLPLSWVLAYRQLHVTDPRVALNDVLDAIIRDIREASGGKLGKVDVSSSSGAIALGGAIGGMIGQGVYRERIKAKTKAVLPDLAVSRAIHDLTQEEKIFLKGACLAIAEGYERGSPTLNETYAGELTRAMAYACWAGGIVNVEMEEALYRHEWSEVFTRAARDLMTIVYGNEADHQQRMADWASEIVASVDDLKGHWLGSLLETASLTIGSAQWFDPRDVDAGGVFVDHVPGKTLQLGSIGEQMIGFGGNESLITIAGPGAGKTQCHVLPNVAAYNGPSVILDIKGEVYPETAPIRAAAGKRVLRFSLQNDGEDNACYNPLDHVSSDLDELWDDAVTTATLLIEKPAHEKDPFWTSSARDLVATYVAGVILQTEHPTLETLMDQLMAAGEDRIDALAGFAKTGIDHGCKQLEQTASALIAMAGDTPKLIESVYATVREKLSPLQSPSVRKATTHSDWAPLDLRVPGTTLYLVVPLKRLEALAPFLRLLIGQHIYALTETAPPRDTLPVTFFLDELPQLGNFDAVIKAVEIGRSYALRVWGFAQNPQQIETAFERSSVLLSNPAVRCYMNVDDIRVAQRVSLEIGEVENALTGDRRPLVKPSELMSSADYRDAIIALGRGTPTGRLTKRFFF